MLDLRDWSVLLYTSASLRPREILYRYVARELVRPTGLTLAVLTAVLLTRDLPAYTDLMINRGADPSRVASILGCQCLVLVAQMLPFSALVGGLVGLGRLVADSEVMALSALGLDPRRLIGPVALFGSGMACLTLGMSVVVSPEAQRAMNETVREIANVNPFSTIEPDGVHRIGDWKIEVRGVSEHGQVLERVLLWMPAVGETIFARTAHVTGSGEGASEIELRNGVLLTSSRHMPRALRFDALRTRVPEATETATLPFEDRLKSLSFSALASVASNRESGALGHEAQSELQRRIAMPVATLLLGVLALPLALGRSKTSRASGALLGLAIIIGYYGLVQAAEGIAQKLPAISALATWLPNAVLLGTIGLLFLGLAGSPGRSGGRSERRRSQTATSAGAGARPIAAVRVRQWALSRYVASRFLQLAMLSLAVLVIAYLLVDVLERLQWFARHAASFDEIVHFYSARIPLLISRVAPMGLVVAMALTVGLLTSTGELLAMRTLGISARSALRPALLLCLLSTPVFFVLNDQIVPRTNALADLIKQSEIKKEDTRHRTAIWGRKGLTLYQLERLDATRGAGRGIIIYELLDDGLPTRRIDAHSALHVGDGHWQLLDATAVTFADPARLSSVEPPSVVELGEEPSAELDLMYFSVAQLFALIREVASAGGSTTALEVDLHVKLAMPLACFILPALVMLIASTGPPFPGSATTLLVAGTIAVAYTLLAGAFASFGRGGVLPPWLGGWGPNLIAFVGLVGLMGRDRVDRRARSASRSVV